MQKIWQVIPWAMAAGRAVLGPVVLLGDRCGWSGATLAAMVVSALLSDIFDGVLARRWRVDTAAVRLCDSICDMVFYVCVGIALWPRIWRADASWLVVLLMVEAANILFALAKFGRPASYHSYLAKAWGLVLATAVIAMLLTSSGGAWMRIALGMGVASNLETMVMSLMLPIWHRDVKTLRVAWQIRQQLVSPSAWRRTMRQQTRWTRSAIVALISLVAAASILHAQTDRANALQDRIREGQALAQETQARGYWLDSSTGLMWAAKDNGKDVSQKRAAKYCRNLRIEGHSDWRLPNIAELEKIYDRKTESPGEIQKSHRHDAEPMTFHVKGGLFLTGDEWSNEQRMDDRGHPSGYAWYFDFNEGRSNNEPSGFLYPASVMRALCVRQP